LANPFGIKTEDAWPKSTDDFKSITIKICYNLLDKMMLPEKSKSLTGQYCFWVGISEARRKARTIPRLVVPIIKGISDPS